MGPFRLVAVLAAMVAAISAAAPPARSPGFPGGAGQYLWALDGAGSLPVADAHGDLAWRGGDAGAGAIGVETRPAVYLVFWGPRWARGFSIRDTDGRSYSSRSLQRYLTAFFAAVGGSGWAGVLTQYCTRAQPGADTCPPGSTHIANPAHQLRGVWVDAAPVPAAALAGGPGARAGDDPVAAEARRAAQHFGTDPEATYLILAQPGGRETGSPVWCGYHDQTAGADASGAPVRLQYAFLPWLDRNWPGHGWKACGMHAVNRTSDAFGNGVFDGYSIVAGHEYAEAISDPDDFANVQDGWNDGYSLEAADKCAWRSMRDVVLGGRRFAVQALWSNRAFDAGRGGCVFGLQG